MVSWKVRCLNLIFSANLMWLETGKKIARNCWSPVSDMGMSLKIEPTGRTGDPLRSCVNNGKLHIRAHKILSWAFFNSWQQQLACLNTTNAWSDPGTGVCTYYTQKGIEGLGLHWGGQHTDRGIDVERKNTTWRLCHEQILTWQCWKYFILIVKTSCMTWNIQSGCFTWVKLYYFKICLWHWPFFSSNSLTFLLRLVT